MIIASFRFFRKIFYPFFVGVPPLPLFLLLFFSISNISAEAQEIDFGNYSSRYSATVSPLNPSEDLEFGLIFINEGLKSIPINDAKVLIIEGVKYLDVIVDVTADEYLLLNGDLGCQEDITCRIPFTLQAAYANRGSNNINQANLMTIASNIASAQFQIEQRGNQPPGPPPTPVSEGYDPAVYHKTAYLYIYGSLNVGNINAGSYTANVTVTISYD